MMKKSILAVMVVLVVLVTMLSVYLKDVSYQPDNIFLIVIIVIVGLALGVFWAYMIWNCIKRDFDNEVDKFIWLIFMIITHFVGAFVYYFLIKRKGMHPNV